MTVVCQLMPSLSINDDYQAFHFHHSIILPCTIFGAAIVLHFSMREVLYTSSKEVCLNLVIVILCKNSQPSIT